MSKRLQPKPKRLLVEGQEELRVIPELIEKNGVEWGKDEDSWIVEIDVFGGVEELLKPGVIEAELKSSGLTHLGLLVDADEVLENRWNAIRDRCSKAFPTLPSRSPGIGVIVDNGKGLRLGVWIMPDNKTAGMLETFLGFLVPNTQDDVYIAAQESVTRARDLGAPYIDAHVNKANIYTWLAWQNPPGRQLHQAVQQQILNPSATYAQPFVTWFRNLYEI
jgi:hypothetical protein